MERELVRSDEEHKNRVSRRCPATGFFMTYLNVSLGLSMDLCAIVWSELDYRYKSKCVEKETFNQYREYALSVAGMSMWQYNLYTIKMGYFRLMSNVPFDSIYACFTVLIDSNFNEFYYTTYTPLGRPITHKREIWHESVRKYLILHSFLINLRDYLHIEFKHNIRWDYKWCPLEVTRLSQLPTDEPKGFGLAIKPEKNSAEVICTFIFQQENGVTNGVSFHLQGRALGSETSIKCDLPTAVQIIACFFHIVMCDYWIGNLPEAHKESLSELLETSKAKSQAAALVVYCEIREAKQQKLLETTKVEGQTITN